MTFNSWSRWTIRTLTKRYGDPKEAIVLDYSPSIAYDLGMAKRRSKKMTDQIRQAIDDSGLTRYRIAQETSIDESTLAKFYHGHRGMSLGNLDRLCDYLGLRVVMDQRKEKKGK